MSCFTHSLENTVKPLFSIRKTDLYRSFRLYVCTTVSHTLEPGSRFTCTHLKMLTLGTKAVFTLRWPYAAETSMGQELYLLDSGRSRYIYARPTCVCPRGMGRFDKSFISCLRKIKVSHTYSLPDESSPENLYNAPSSLMLPFKPCVLPLIGC